MYMSRDVFHCKPGKAKELVLKFRALSDALVAKGYAPSRIYTDVSGEKYWTVVVEQDVKSVDEMAEMSRSVGTDAKLKKAMKNYHDLVQNGYRELYKAE